MGTITITMPDNLLEQLKKIASDFNVTVEELICLSIESVLVQPEQDFLQAMSYILNKNHELYQGLK